MPAASTRALLRRRRDLITGAAPLFAVLIAACGGAEASRTAEAPVARVAAAPRSGAAPAAAFEHMVVGTEHRGHLQIADYPMGRLDDLLRSFRPDLVLVEIRPEAFRESRYEDGPLEMSYVTLHARALGVAVEPIDWYLDADVGRDVPDDPAAYAAFEAEVGPLGAAVDSFAPFAIVNGARRAQDFLFVQNAAARHGLAQSAAWNRRQSWFHHRAVLAIEAHHARRVAAFVGYAHRPELDLWLTSRGGASVSPLSVPSGETPPAAADVLPVWRAGIARMRQRQATASPDLAKSLARKIRYWEIAVERKGACCVEDGAFVVP